MRARESQGCLPVGGGGEGECADGSSGLLLHADSLIGHLCEDDRAALGATGDPVCIGGDREDYRGVWVVLRGEAFSRRISALYENAGNDHALSP